MSIVMSYIAPFEATSAAFGIMSNVIVSAKDNKAAINQARRHLATRVIPRMGRSSGLSDRTSAAGRILSKHVLKATGHFANERVTCECGGHFVADKHGNYVCSVCGIVEDFQGIKAPAIEPLDFNDDEEEEVSDEDDFDYGAVTEERVTSKARDGASALEARLARHQAAWKAALAERPSDEQRAKDSAHEAKDRHKAVLRANRASDQVLTYQGKWQEAQRHYRLRRILAAIREGMADTSSLRKHIGASNNAFYADIEQLKADGRVTSVVEGRKQTLTIVAREAPARRVPARKYETSFREARVNWHTEQQTSFPWKE